MFHVKHAKNLDLGGWGGQDGRRDATLRKILLVRIRRRDRDAVAPDTSAVPAEEDATETAAPPPPVEAAPVAPDAAPAPVPSVVEAIPPAPGQGAVRITAPLASPPTAPSETGPVTTSPDIASGSTPP